MLLKTLDNDKGQPIKNIKTSKEKMNNHVEIEAVYISISSATINC